ncbi:MAG: hypothetical protein E7465_07480 [Ruminococcaceae bacterium]|nr:hypothetical protein [Oscillospiraceae bacterium]
MDLRKIKEIKWNYLAIAFGIPVVFMLVVMMVAGAEPFGTSSMLYSDMYHQYYPFFKAFRRALLSGDSLLYSWNVGLGMDYLGLISYYLASPLNLLSVLIPEAFLLEFYSLLMPVKLGLASLFFASFLKQTFRKNDISIALFGSFYGMCAWALGFQWNIMWLDTFALLPLVALGTVSLLRDKKFVLYTLTLFLSIYANYYIGFFTCIFVLLLFICYQVCRCTDVKVFFADLLRIAFFSALAIAMTAVLTLPAFAALQTTQSSVNQFPTTFRLNIADENTWKGLLDAMRQVAGNMSGAVELNFKEGLPNIYAGVGTILLGFLYLLSGEVKFRDKLCCVLLLLFFNISFIIRQLDYIWHGFHFTNMIPYRFSFLYCFVMLYMAYRAWLMRNKFKIWQTLLAALFTACIMACSDARLNPEFLAFNVSFLLLYLAAFVYGQYRGPKPKEGEEVDPRRLKAARNRRRNAARTMLALIMVAELIANVVNFGCRFSFTNTVNYPKDTKYSASMIRYMVNDREEDTLFFRAETTHSQTLNDGALNGYNGISAFTSSANVKTTVFMQALGYGAKNTYNRYCYEEASPVSNLFLGLKYMIDRDGKDKQSQYFDYVHHYGNTYLYENTAYLPLGFLADRELADVDFDNSSVFNLQNRIFSAATGVKGDVWHTVSGSSLEITGEDVTVSDTNSSGYCSYSEGLANSKVYYTYTVEQDGFMCVNLNLPKRNAVSISLNGVELYTETMSLPQMLAVGDVAVGDVVTVRMTCKANEKGTMTLTAAILNNSRFREGYEVLAQCPLELTTFRNTFVEGTVSCNRDGLLYASIPQNGNWSVLVDGEEAETVLVGDCMIGVELTEGEHTITYVYRNAAFSLGWKISAVCAAVFLILYVMAYKPKLPKHVKGKFEK